MTIHCTGYMISIHFFLATTERYSLEAEYWRFCDKLAIWKTALKKTEPKSKETKK